MVPLLQSFDFSYADGLLFYDRSGALARQLQQIIPGLILKDAATDQRELSSPQEEIDLFFGIRVARIQTFSPGKSDFSSLAASFLGVVAETMEINQLSDFHFRHILGRPCASLEEAQELMWPLFPEETKAKLHAVAQPSQWRAAQYEFLLGNFAVQGRVAVMDLIPHASLLPAGASPGEQIPHITFHLDMRGFVPIDVAEFDAKAFIENVRVKHTEEILSKLAPHLAQV